MGYLRQQWKRKAQEKNLHLKIKIVRRSKTYDLRRAVIATSEGLVSSITQGRIGLETVLQTANLEEVVRTNVNPYEQKILFPRTVGHLRRDSAAARLARTEPVLFDHDWEKAEDALRMVSTIKNFGRNRRRVGNVVEETTLVYHKSGISIICRPVEFPIL